MRVAKPTVQDLDAAADLAALLGDLSRGYYPWDDDDEDAPKYFDPDDQEHLRRLHDSLRALLKRAPGFPLRVALGMSAVCWDRNAILDPTDDCMTLHPDLFAGRELLMKRRAEFLPRLESDARSAVAEAIERAAQRHLAEMGLD